VEGIPAPLPPGWQWVSLADLQAAQPRAITDGPFGSHLTSAHYTEQGPRVVRLQNIGDGRFVDANAHISQQHFESLRAHEVIAGDLLIASLGDDPPRACLAPSTLGPAIVKADCIRVRLASSVDPRWVMYALQTPAVRGWASEKMYGVGRPRLGLKTIRAIPIPLPPLDEQRRIVDLLEDHLSRLGAATVTIRSAISRVRAWHRGSVDRILWPSGDGGPSGTVPVGLLLSERMRNGHSAPASTSRAGVRTLTLTAVTRNDFSDQFTKMTTADVDRVQDLWLQPGDILVQRANTAELVGTTAIYEGDPGWAIFPDLLIRLRADSGQILPKYLAATLRSERAHRALRSRAKGLAGSMPKIDQAAIADVRVPVPSSPQQQRSVEELEALDSSRDSLLADLHRANMRAESLRRSLLEAAFCGRLT